MIFSDFTENKSKSWQTSYSFAKDDVFMNSVSYLSVFRTLCAKRSVFLPNTNYIHQIQQTNQKQFHNI